jgi:hypothetical protein
MRWHSPPRRKSLSLRHAPGTARTCNLQFRRLSLYPVELRVLIAEPLTIGHNPGLARGKWAADFTGRHPIAYGIGHRLHRFSQIKTNAVKLSCQWLVASRQTAKGKSCSCSSSCSCSICWASAAKRESDFPIMILFNRFDSKTSAFSSMSTSTSRKRGEAYFATALD